jgi:hypothetical protein
MDCTRILKVVELADLSDIILASLISIGGHPLGHIEEGQRQNVEVGLNVPSLTEHWNSDDRKKRLRINGAGFRAQDGLKNYGGKDVSLANGLYKLGYLAGLPQKMGVPTEGDINLMAKDLGNSRYVKGSLLASALADLHKNSNPDRKWDLDFWQSSEGIPGLAYRRKF